MSLTRTADQISKVAYWSYLVLGLGHLIPVLLFLLFEQLGQLGFTYVLFLILVAPVLGTIAVVLSIVRQFWGTEWKLLALLASTTMYVSIVFMMDTGMIPASRDEVVMVAYGAVASFLPVWHFVTEKQRLADIGPPRST